MSIMSVLQEKFQHKRQSPQTLILDGDKLYSIDLSSSTKILCEVPEGTRRRSNGRLPPVNIDEQVHAFCRVEGVDDLESMVMVSRNYMDEITDTYPSISPLFKDTFHDYLNFRDMYVDSGETVTLTPVRFLGRVSKTQIQEIKNIHLEETDHGVSISRLLDLEGEDTRAAFEKSWIDFLESRGDEYVSISEASESQHLMFGGDYNSDFHNDAINCKLTIKAVVLEVKSHPHYNEVILSDIPEKGHPTYKVPVGGRDPDEVYKELIRAVKGKSLELDGDQEGLNVTNETSLEM